MALLGRPSSKATTAVVCTPGQLDRLRRVQNLRSHRLSMLAPWILVDVTVNLHWSLRRCVLVE